MPVHVPLSQRVNFVWIGEQKNMAKKGGNLASRTRNSSMWFSSRKSIYAFSIWWISTNIFIDETKSIDLSHRVCCVQLKFKEIYHIFALRMMFRARKCRKTVGCVANSCVWHSCNTVEMELRWKLFEWFFILVSTATKLVSRNPRVTVVRCDGHHIVIVMLVVLTLLLIDQYA